MRWHWGDGKVKVPYRWDMAEQGTGKVLAPCHEKPPASVVSPTLSAKDYAFLLQSKLATNVECGDPEENGWPRDWMNNTVSAVSRSQDGHWATYRFDWNPWPGPLQLCLCEAPQCSESWRFGQQLSLPLPPPAHAGCQSVLTRVTIPFKPNDWYNWGWGGLVAINGTLFAMPARADFVLSADLLEGTRLSFSRIDVTVNGLQGRPWTGAVEVNGCLYSAPYEPARSANEADVARPTILVFNATSRQIHGRPIPDGPDGQEWHGSSALASANGSLYFIQR